MTSNYYNCPAKVVAARAEPSARTRVCREKRLQAVHAAEAHRREGVAEEGPEARH